MLEFIKVGSYFAVSYFVQLLLVIHSQVWMRVDYETFGSRDSNGCRVAYEGEPIIHLEWAKIKEEETVFSASFYHR